MKQAYLLIGSFLTLGTAIFAQSTPVSQTVQKRVALLEELTGVNCQYCPDGHKIADNIVAANPGKVIAVNIHAGGYANPGTGQPDFRTTNGTAIDNWINVDGYPSGTVSRTAFGNTMYSNRGQWATQVGTKINEDSPVNIAMNATIDATTRIATVNVEIYYTTPFAAGTTQYLNVGMLQDSVLGPQSGGTTWYPANFIGGQYIHNKIFRGMINNSGTWGDTINAAQTGVITKTFTYTIPATIGNVNTVLDQLSFFAFIHKGQNQPTTSQVESAAKIHASVINIPGPTAHLDAIVNDLGTCNNGTITPVFKVVNGGQPITGLAYSMSVNGGTPTTHTWTGTIPQFGSTQITAPAVTITTTSSTNNITITITSVNNGSGTIGTASKTKAINVTNKMAPMPALTVKTWTDAFGTETTWTIKNSGGTTIASAGPYSNQNAAGAYPQADVSATVNPNECYVLTVNDSYGDGFNDGYGNGKIEIHTSMGIVLTLNQFVSSSKSEYFFTPANLAINEITETINMAVYPNPATDKLNVAFDALNGDYTIELTDLAGRVVTSEVHSNLTGAQQLSVNTSNLHTGNYLVSIINNGLKFTKMVSIQ